MYEITYEMGFEAAHFLPGHSKCGQTHGHSYKVLVTLGSEQLEEDGMVIDFGEVKQLLAQILPDHKLLNDLFDFPPTAENLAAYFYWQLNDVLPESANLVEVTVWETDKASATYYERV